MNNIIDLFCGCGGLSKGFEMAGFNTVLAIDFWKDAVETFNNNHKNKVAICDDVSKISNEFLDDFTKKNKITGIVGGPPCQGYSTVGKRDINDDRNYLYLQYCRIVEKVKPEFFVLENVKGLLTLNNGKFKEDIVERFTKLGYIVDYKILNSADYGVPQNRNRVFFVGIKNKKFKFPKEKSIKVTTHEAISDLTSYEDKYTTSAQTSYQKNMRGNNKQLKNNEFTVHTEKTIDVISKIPDGGKITDLPKEFWEIRKYNKAFQRMNSKLQSNTIDTGHRNYFHYSENRIPTVRESARIQSFPDNFIFYGSRTSQYKQVGNAVPPLLANAIAIEIMKQIGGDEDGKDCS
jgi:DNA (cytosine-5)-methyltransferase 1